MLTGLHFIIKNVARIHPYSRREDSGRTMADINIAALQGKHDSDPSTYEGQLQRGLNAALSDGRIGEHLTCSSFPPPVNIEDPLAGEGRSGLVEKGGGA